MIAIAVLAALGQAIQAGATYLAITALVALAVAIVGLGCLLAPQEHEHAREAQRLWEPYTKPGTDDESGSGE